MIRSQDSALLIKDVNDGYAADVVRFEGIRTGPDGVHTRPSLLLKTRNRVFAVFVDAYRDQFHAADRTG